MKKKEYVNEMDFERTWCTCEILEGLRTRVKDGLY